MFQAVELEESCKTWKTNLDEWFCIFRICINETNGLWDFIAYTASFLLDLFNSDIFYIVHKFQVTHYISVTGFRTTKF